MVRPFMAYLVPIVVIGYSALNFFLFKSLKYHKKSERDMFIKGYDEMGVRLINVNSIQWFEREGRRYYAHAVEGKYRVKNSLSILEAQYSSIHFLRINRFVLVNLKYIKNYSYWENEKYVVRMNDAGKTEFPMTRERLKTIKDKLLV